MILIIQNFWTVVHIFVCTVNLKHNEVFLYFVHIKNIYFYITIVYIIKNECGLDCKDIGRVCKSLNFWPDRASRLFNINESIITCL